MPAAEPEVSLPGFAFGVADELGKRICRHRGVHDNDIRVGRQRGYGNEILHRIVVEIFVQRRRDRVLVGAAGQQRVTVGRSTRNIAPANSAAGAGNVFDDDGLAEIGREIMRRDTHRGVGRSAWRVWHDDFDGMVGKVLRAHRQTRNRGDNTKHDRDKVAHHIPFPCVSATIQAW